MAYPFVAAPDHWPRGGVPVRAIAIHHAEGGGTVSWLTRNDDDKPFTFMGEVIVYGVTANKAALGEYWRNPNAAVIAIEVEGFAAEGPNAAQRISLGRLVVDIRTRHDVPALGHRDWQNYKACPGRKIPWVDYGGHGNAGPGDDMPGLKVTLTGDKAISGVFRSTIATEAIYLHDRSIRDDIAAGRAFQALATYARDFDGAPGVVLTESRTPSWVSETAGTFTPDAPSSTPSAPHTVSLTVDGQSVYSETLA